MDDLHDPELRAPDAHHLRTVLRLRDGALVVAADGVGGWRPCRFRLPAAGLEPDGPLLRAPEPDPPVTVAFVPVKGERPEWVVQKLTEVGVDRVVVLHTARSVVRWDRQPAQQERALQRLRRVAESAAAQSRRPRLPSVDGITDLSTFVEAESVRGISVAVADVGGPPPRLSHPTIAVGPEGGWTDPERATPGTAAVGLGPAVLRAETAAVAAGVIICALRGGSVLSRDEDARPTGGVRAGS